MYKSVTEKRFSLLPTAEALFSIVSKQLSARKEKLFDRYHTLMLEESQVSGVYVSYCFIINSKGWKTVIRIATTQSKVAIASCQLQFMVVGRKSRPASKPLPNIKEKLKESWKELSWYWH